MVQGTVLVDYKWVTTNFKRAPDRIRSRLCTYTRHYSASVSIGSLRHFQSGSHLVPQCNLHSIARLLAATPTTDRRMQASSKRVDWLMRNVQAAQQRTKLQAISFLCSPAEAAVRRPSTICGRNVMLTLCPSTTITNEADKWKTEPLKYSL